MDALIGVIGGDVDEDTGAETRGDKMLDIITMQADKQI